MARPLILTCRDEFEVIMEIGKMCIFYSVNANGIKLVVR